MIYHVYIRIYIYVYLKNINEITRKNIYTLYVNGWQPWNTDARSPDVTQEYVVPSQDGHMAGTSLGEIMVLICFNICSELGHPSN